MTDDTDRALGQIAAEAEIARFQAALGPFVVAAEKTRMPMIFTDARAPEGLMVFANDSFLALTGYDRHEVIGRSLTSMMVKRAAREMLREGAHRQEGCGDDEPDTMFRRKDGSAFWAAMLSCAVPDKAGNIAQNFISLIDLTKYKKSETALLLSEHRFRMAAHATGLGIADTNLLTQEEHWSAELRGILGVSDDTPASALAYSSLIHPDDREAAMQWHVRSLAGQEDHENHALFRIIRSITGELRWIDCERHVEFDEVGRVVRVIVTNRDITTEKTARDQIAWAATHDSVTGLPNRTAFRNQTETALATAALQGDDCSMMLIDLDQFKSINDMLGHQAGDDALSAFADRIAKAMPEHALLARLGGDEFAAILPGTDIAAAKAIGEELLAHLKPPFHAGDRTIDLRASIGVSAFPLDGRGYSALVHSADLALYSAKEAGGSKVRAFSPVLRARRRAELSMLRDAREVLDNGWIEPFYQPKIILATGRVAGFEALLRWRHPRAGPQLPGTIAPAFGDSYLAGLLGITMADAVLMDMSKWAKAGTFVGKIAINVSAAEFLNPDYAPDLLDRLKRHGISASDLELEITETTFLDKRGGNVIAALDTLRAAGMTVALDDFGTGFSSLSHLRDFPVDTIKIDRSFVIGLESSQRDRDIIRAILQLGNALGMTTIAEGVETQAQADFLSAHGCMFGQGFLFAPALAAAEATHRTEYGAIPHDGGSRFPYR